MVCSPMTDFERIAEITAPHTRWQFEDESDHWISVSAQKYDELTSIAERQTRRLEEAEKVLKNLLDKIELLTPEINNAFAFQEIHGITYKGPDWVAELEAATAWLTERMEAPND